jgi:hypothetical protein
VSCERAPIIDPIKDESNDENLYDAIIGKGEEVAWQDWDSGGPGAGAGRVSVYRHKEVFYVFHDAGLEGPYSTKREAVEENQVGTINSVTQEIWDKDAGFIFKRSEPSRLALLRSQVVGLSVDEQYRAALLKSIDIYGDQILALPLNAPDESWDDLEALQQVTLGDVMERALQEKFRGQS